MIAVIDQAQYDANSGPCLDSFRSGQTRIIEDTEQEARWPEFAEAAVSHGVRSTLSLPLMAHDQGIGALNLYGRRPQSFSPGDHV